MPFLNELSRNETPTNDTKNVIWFNEFISYIDKRYAERISCLVKEATQKIWKWNLRVINFYGKMLITRLF